MEARRHAVAIALGSILLVAAACAAAVAVASEHHLAPSRSLDPSHRGVLTAGGLAAALCLVAFWRLLAAARGRAGWFDAGLWLVFAVVSLIVVDVVAIAARLGG